MKDNVLGSIKAYMSAFLNRTLKEGVPCLPTKSFFEKMFPIHSGPDDEISLEKLLINLKFGL